MKAQAICNFKPLQRWSWVSLFLVGGLWVSAPWSASAFLTDSEYHVATESEHLLLNSADHWDSEAASDFLTYQRPLGWDGLWWRNAKAFDLSMGSLSTRQFLIARRLKIEVPLSDHLDVRIQYLETRDFEQDRRSFPLELRYSLGQRLALSAIGEPSLYKAEDDLGAALTYWPSHTTELKFTALWGDFQRNQRSLSSDEWSEPPRAFTLAAQYLPAESSQEFTRMELHYEPHSERTDTRTPTKSLSYQMASLTGFLPSATSMGLSFRVQADRAQSENFAAREIRVRNRALMHGESIIPLARKTLRPGLNFFYRESRLNEGREFIRELLPTVWIDDQERTLNDLRLRMSYGYELTAFERESDLHNDQSAVEHRLNIKADFILAHASELAFIFTFDLDKFGSGETWEGGAGQFRLNF